MIERFCDKCEKKFDGTVIPLTVKDKFSHVEDTFYYGVIKRDVEGNKQFELLDLCPGCQKELIGFLGYVDNTSAATDNATAAMDMPVPEVTPANTTTNANTNTED